MRVLRWEEFLLAKPTTRVEKKAMFGCACPTCYENQKDYKKMINRAKRRQSKQKIAKELK